jgi:predicted ribosome quality control (RQC) complex YloA/Tae2 family protein
MNGIYLYLFLKEIRSRLIDQPVREMRIADRIVQVVLDDYALYVSLYPQAPALFLAPVQRKGYEKNTQLAGGLSGCRIIDVTQDHFMPVLQVRMEKTGIADVQELKLTIILYKEAPNITMSDGRKQKKLYTKLVRKTPKRSIVDLDENEISELSARSSRDLASYLLNEIGGVDKYLAQEMTPALLLELRRILAGARMRPRLVSIVPMQVSLFAEEYVQVYRSLNDLYKDGIARFLGEKQKAAQEAQRRSITRKIKKRIARLQKKILTKKAIEEYRIAGELILGNINKIKRGDSLVRLFDPYQNKEKEISLDPGKSAQQNAQAYFIRYKKAKRGQPALKKKIAVLTKELQDISISLPAEKPAAKRPRAKDAVSQPFRTFMLESGAIVYVGKSARSNDQLTFGFARPHDYFFHVRGYEGSHVILRMKVPKMQKPPKQVMMTAASIAAYYSKAKTQKNVPVSYTQRKYVKKDRKGKTGAAIMMREQVMFVDPELPEKDT